MLFSLSKKRNHSNISPFFIPLGFQYVHGSLEDPKTLTHHKLVHAATERVLADTKTVADENLKDKGKLTAIGRDLGGRRACAHLTVFYTPCRSFAAHEEKTAANPSKDGRSQFG